MGGQDRQRRRQGWTVRAHLAAIVVAVVAVFVGVGLVFTRQTLASAKATTRGAAGHAAGVAGDAIGHDIEAGVAQTSALAANPQMAALLADPSGCQLAFALDLFPRSRLDIIHRDGTLACSSDPTLVSGAPVHTGAPWLAQLATADGPVEGRPAPDSVTRTWSVAFASPVRGHGSVLGAVVMVAPTEALARQLTKTYGGFLGYDFGVVDGYGARLTGKGSLNAAGYLAESRRVPGTSWHVEAGLEPSVALSRTYDVLRRAALLGAAAFFVLLAALAVVNRRIARPLRRLTSAVAATGPRERDLLATVAGPAEVMQLAEELRSAFATHEDYENQLSHQALHDPLTGLPNRALLTERLAHTLEQSVRSRKLVAVLFLDLDRFKVVNDSLGHVSGDRVLVDVARRLESVMRPGDTLARFGGDEFVAVGEGFADRAEIEVFASRLLDAIDAPIATDERTVHLSASIGIAVGDGTSRVVDLIREADTAMYVAKDQGRAQLAVFDATLRDQATHRLSIETALRAALERDNEFRLVYQPVLDLRDQRIVGVEALLRWDNATLGAISPIDFIPIAEESNLIVAIGEFVLNEACRQQARWRDEGFDLRVAINISDRQLAHGHLPTLVADALAAHDLPADRLCLELTERLLLQDTMRITGLLSELRALGTRVSIDDFGTGYSSLAYLHRFPIDELKIDQIFVHDLTHPDQRTLVGAMIAMGGALGLDVVAEGVETHEQAEQLRTLGGHLAQGYLFSRPVAPGEVERLLREAPATTG